MRLGSSDTPAEQRSSPTDQRPFVIHADEDMPDGLVTGALSLMLGGHISLHSSNLSMVRTMVVGLLIDWLVQWISFFNARSVLSMHAHFSQCTTVL